MVPAIDDNSLGAIYSMPCNAGHVLVIDSFKDFFMCFPLEASTARQPLFRLLMSAADTLAFLAAVVAPRLNDLKTPYASLTSTSFGMMSHLSI